MFAWLTQSSSGDYGYPRAVRRETRLTALSTRSASLKRALDIVASIAAIVVFLPLMAIIACAIWVRDGSPILYGHERIGKGGRSFKCWKFRTMVRDADKRLADLLKADQDAFAEWKTFRKLKNDPRIIKGIGHFLRKSSLDELPQFFNVLLGDMSLVGPRPIIADELEKYGAAQDHYTSIRPGVTGPWQISDRSDGSYTDRVLKDVDYVENWSLQKDVLILVKTVAVPFKQSGAY